ncbi:DUF6059 family protein [Kitasatospora sp. NPDC048239]|uniref:DUF6059 family protein n=1 Tax=Kitasatospora sp. NPDC048239 TaxID=3364046 RepID=UPI00371E27B7
MRRYWAGWLDRVGPGLSALACVWGMGPCLPVPEDPEPPAVERRSRGSRAARGLAGLPLDHPERPAGHIPPTAVERALWQQFDRALP